MNKMNPKVDAVLKKSKQWQEETERLRAIMLDCQLTEELKWSKPCYTFQGSNVVLIQGFKPYCALLFFKGFQLEDPHGILVKTGENTRVGRQIRFTNVQEIVKMRAIVKGYVLQAVEVEKSGLKAMPQEEAELKLPEELRKKLDGNPTLKAAFGALTPGRQRGYGFYFSAPKQSKTRESRIDKCTKQILKGKGLHDR